MTEDEAKIKWCPFVRITLRTGHGAGNKVMDGDWGGPQGPNNISKASRCIGSKCMAWRETNPAVAAGMLSRNMVPNPAYSEFEFSIPAVPAMIEVPGDPQPGSPAEGYCGLAGKP